MQNNLKRKREENEKDWKFQPPRKIKVLDEAQTYIDLDSSKSSSSDGSTTDGDLSSSVDSIVEDMDWKSSQEDKEVIKEAEPVIEDRQEKLKQQWTKILPTLKRTKCYCDLFEDDCPYHFPKKDDDDEPPHMCCSA